ncbi:MAG: Beta-ketoacyl-acyl-carrier-protein synthase [Cytophagaceae bacterium]|jgi:3-oxoacyl-[acyl-carrier-protein] synthase-3|nr:Beta-ketoacyl-acyl-carrier-protein synthase [Cytophagaceae bacterium]
MSYSYIKAVRYYLPEKVYTNEDYFRDFPEQRGNKSLKKIGVQQRSIASAEELTSDLGVQASEKLFAEFPIHKNEIDFLIFCGGERDYDFPKTSGLIQHRLGLPKRCGTIDMIDGCSGYLYGLHIAKGLIELNEFKNILLINSVTTTKDLHPKDKGSRFIFGDAAAVTLISAREEPGMGIFEFGTDGSQYDKIIRKDGGARHPLTASSYTEKEDAYGNVTSDAHLYMNGVAVFNFGLHTVPQVIQSTLVKNKISLEDVDLFIFHQANLFLIKTICSLLKIADDKVFNYMEKTGNTVSASIPIVLSEAIQSGKAKKGDKIVLCGFGVGLSWSGTLITM